MPVSRRIKSLLGLVAMVAVGTASLKAANSYTMKELLSTQHFDRLESPFPIPVRLYPIAVSETEGWNGSLDDRWHSSDAFRGTYAEEFMEGLTYYLKARGFDLGTSKDAMQVRVTIDRFNGRKRIHDDGGDLKGTLVLKLYGKAILKKPLFESLSYTDESSECLAFAKQFGLPEVQFPTVLFYRLTASFYASIAQGILDAGEEIDSPVPSPPAKTAPPESKETGLLTIESDPDTAEIYLDSRLVATTPAKRLRLSVGNHLITLKKAGFADWVRELTVLEDSDLTLKATLEKSQP
jgi:PEGA domain-containing protein